MDLELSGRSAIVTGSYRGTGEGLARVLAREGAFVWVHGFELELHPAAPSGQVAVPPFGQGLQDPPSEKRRGSRSHQQNDVLENERHDDLTQSGGERSRAAL